MEQQKTSASAQNDLTAYLDPSISPTDDFHAHATRKWCDANPIPAKESIWGEFYLLRDLVKTQLHELLQELVAAKELPAGSNEEKLRDFWIAAMDEARAEAFGLGPIENELRDIKLTCFVFMKQIASMHKGGMNPLWEPSVMPDTKDSATNRLYFEQAGLSLPEREYYFSRKKGFTAIRRKFLAYMTEMMRCYSDEKPEDAAETAAAVFALEKRLARVSLPAAKRRDEEKQYHKMTFEELRTCAPRINWGEYLNKICPHGRRPEFIIVRQPKFLKECGVILEEAAENPKAQKVLMAYLRWHLLNKTAPLLSRRFADAHFGFYGATLSGATEQKPRWERALAATNEVLGYALGERYVAKHFPPEAKARIEALMDDLQSVLKRRLENLPWMGEETKKRALAKIATFTRKLGYPEKSQRDYSQFWVGGPNGSYAGKYFRGCEAEFAHMMCKMDKPADRSEWHYPPQTVNASYLQSFNQIIFPAGILQPPFFYADGEDAVNYGAIGFVIGHELTHGFDDKGSKFDENGNLAQWWNDEDREQFMARAAVLKKQYEAHTVCGLPVNGELTLGENIADLGGLSIALEAFQCALERNGRPENIGGFTPEQRFFLSAARVWRGNTREEYMRQLLVSDPHSPEHLRVNIPCSNMPEFYEAFVCKEGCGMYRPESERAEIW